LGSICQLVPRVVPTMVITSGIWFVTPMGYDSYNIYNYN
jgi:hypothetical protein